MAIMTSLAHRLLLLSAVSIICIYFFVTMGPTETGRYASDLLSNTKTNLGLQDASATTGNEERLAYMTLITGTMADKSETDINADPYFVATRLLGYQLMHHNATKSQRNIPFVVLVTEDVPQARKDRLAQDGAIVVEVEYVFTPEWVVGEMPQWKDLMTKLRAWQLTEYSRALFLDGDMILNKCLDGIFDDPRAQFVDSLPETSSMSEEPVPSQYLLATMAEANPNHAYPPTAANNDYKDPDYFNAGFFLFGTSEDMFDYYTELLEHDNIFDPKYVEQNLLNYAHRQDGRMPWQHVETQWNIRFPNMKDKDGGAHSFHDKVGLDP